MLPVDLPDHAGNVIAICARPLREVRQGREFFIRLYSNNCAPLPTFGL